MTRTFKPWRVGEVGVVVVGLEGVIDSIGDDTVTVQGVTVPRRLTRPVRYLSMDFPEGDETTCSRDHCTDACAQTTHEEDLEAQIAELAQAVEDEHDARHNGAFRFCSQQLCRSARTGPDGDLP